MSAVSIVVPTLNESANVAVLARRIANALKQTGTRYEIIFVDDLSTDDTISEIKALTATMPVRLLLKTGERGKAYSLLQGFAAARYDTVCMIDADLQYPPEEIVPMLQKLRRYNADIILSDRSAGSDNPIVRQVSSRVFNAIFAKLLFGIRYDTQSALKVFKKKVLTTIDLHPTPWSFDLEFIVRALEADFRIGSHNIAFSERIHGQAKVHVIKVAAELAWSAIRLRLTSSPVKIRRNYQRDLEPAEL